MSVSSPDASDRDLLAAHVAGDTEAFGVLFTRHRDRLWAVALRTTGDREEAADALQDAMVAAFRRAGSFRGDAAVTTWLHRIVVNACLDRLRRRSVRLAVPLPEDDQAHDPARSAPTDPPAPADPQDVALAHDRDAQVLAAVATLPADQRAAIVLVDMQGYSVEETARILQCPPGTVKSRCSRARRRLAPLLLDLAPGNPVAGSHVTPEDAGGPGGPADPPPAADTTEVNRP